MPPKSKQDQSIEVVEVERGRIELCVLGTTPLIMNRLSEKAKRELLLPSARKNNAEKQSTLKHNPLAEFASSAHRLMDDSQPTYLATPSPAWKGALRGAALDQKGSSKAQIGRLTYVEGDYVPIWGLPFLHMSIVRMADTKRTPDVRTRVIVRKWAARVTVNYVRPLVTEQAIVNLFASAGFTQGMGDWRPEKGAGNYGQFTIVSEDDIEYQRLVHSAGRAAQIEAMQNPICYDDDTAELLTWFDETVIKQGKQNLRKIG